MDVGIFIPDANLEHLKTLSAFEKGVRISGHNVIRSSVHTYVDCDIAVVFGVAKKDVPISFPRGEIIRKHQALGKDVIILEKGYVKRDHYYAAGLNKLNGRADFLNKNMPSDRWDKLQTPLVPWKKESGQRGDKILVCGQVPSDASVQHINIAEWCSAVVFELSKYTKRDIIFRPHPLAINRSPHILGAETSYSSLQDDLEEAWTLVTFNSNTAVDAALLGIPVFAFDEGSMAYEVACKDLSLIESPSFPVRTNWASNLAYAQWTLQEMSEGLSWKHLTRYI